MLLADGRIGCVFSEASAEAEKILSQEIYQTCATEVLRSPNIPSASDPRRTGIGGQGTVR